MVRYGAVSSYYAGCQPRQTDSTDTMVAAIHPAVKRTLQGKAPAKRTGPTVSPPNMQLSGQTVKRPETVTPDQQWPRPSISSLAVSGPRYIPPRKKEDPFEIKIPRCNIVNIFTIWLFFSSFNSTGQEVILSISVKLFTLILINKKK